MKLSALILTALMAGVVFCLTSCENQDTVDTLIPPHQVIKRQAVTKAVSVAEALDVASSFAAQSLGRNVNTNSGRSISNAQPVKSANGDQIAYVVNYADGGWAIVCSTRQYYPILAFSDQGHFDVKNLESSESIYGIWLDEISNEISNAGSFDLSEIDQIEAKWGEYSQAVDGVVNSGGLPGGNSPEAVACRTRIKELNDTHYTEGWMFTTLPSVNAFKVPDDVYSVADAYSSPYEYTIVGYRDISNRINIEPLLTTKWYQEKSFCHSQYDMGVVTIAIAQIMKYHRSPDRFRWADMPDNECNQVIEALLYAIVNTAGLQLVDNEYVGAEYSALLAFQQYGYTARQAQHNDAEVLRELNTYRRPVYMQGTNPKTNYGTSWVCDGLRYNKTNYEYYVEFFVNGGYTSLALYSMEDPHVVGMLNPPPTYLHYNWSDFDAEDGWFLSPTPKPGIDYTVNRQNVYVSL